MKLKELRLYKVKIIKDGDVIFEDIAEKMPEEFKELDVETINLESGEAVVEI